MSATARNLCGNLGMPCSFSSELSMCTGCRQADWATVSNLGVLGAQNTPWTRHVVYGAIWCVCVYGAIWCVCVCVCVCVV